MKSLHLEWKHLDVNGQTCRRCADTGDAVLQVVADLIEELRPQGIEVALTETKLSKEEVSQSNSLFFNGRSLEEVLPDLTVSDNPCSSCADICGCGDLCGTEVNCRTVVRGGTVYEAIPASLIREAALRAAVATLNTDQ